MAAVITIAFDDLINIYNIGNKFGVALHTPNLDRLAERGMSFDAAYSPAAVCNPARTAALSGQSQFRTGLQTANDQQWNDVLTPQETVVGMFHEAGWSTYGAGKVFHNSANPGNAALFDQIYDGHFQSHPNTTPTLDTNPIAEPLQPGEQMRDDPNVAWAIDQLSAYDGSENMLMTLGIIKPHRPFIAPEEYFDLYPQDQLRIPYNDGDLDQVSDFYQRYRLQDSYREYLQGNRLELDFIQGYLAAMSYADAKLGEVLDAIEANPALTDASIVVWSDHGFELGEKQTWNKFTLWEEAANIPFIVVDPSLAGGTHNATPISLLDLTPTLLDMGGITPPPGAIFDGDSVLDFAQTPDTGRVAITSMFGSVSMREGEHRLIYYNDGSVEMYNVINDPDQLINLALNPANDALIDQLVARLQAEVQAQGGIFSPTLATLNGSDVADTLMVNSMQTAFGGLGDDTYFVTEGAQVRETANSGYDRVIFAAAEYTIPLNVEFVKNVTYYNVEGFTLTGNRQANYIEIQSTPGVIDAAGGQDTIVGSGTFDRIYGGTGHDLIMGNGGDDTLAGAEGNDTIEPGSGADVIDGGGGWDIASFVTDIEAVTLQMNATGSVDFTDRTSPTNSAIVTTVEQLLLTRSDTVELSWIDGIRALDADALSELVELYVAYFNRAPDAQGLHFWADLYDDGFKLTAIANRFANQPETRALYPDQDDTATFVRAVYENVFGRAVDAEGFAFWTNALNTSDVNRGGFVLDLLEGARAATGSAADVAYLENKADLGVYYALIKGLGNVDQATAAMELFDGSAASSRAAQTAIDDFHNATINDPNGGLVIELVGIVDDPFAL